MREKPVTIEVRKNGQHWAVLAEEQLIALTVYEKGAHALEATLRGLLRYTSRKLFRRAVDEAMNPPKSSDNAKPARATKLPVAAPAVKVKKPAKKKTLAKKEQVKDEAPTSAPVGAPSEAAEHEGTPAQPN